MRFLLGRHSVQFSKVEFCLITGLKFRELPNTSTYDMVENGIHQRYFEGRDEVYDTEGPSFEPSDTEGSDSNGRHIRLARTRRVRFTLPREPRTRNDSRTGDDSRGGVGRQAEDRRYTKLMDALRELQEEVRKSNEKRDQQHQELLDLIQGLQGSTGRTSSHHGDQQKPGVTPREEVTRGTSGTDTTLIEIEQEPQQVLLDQHVHSQDLVQSTSLQHTPLVDPSAEHPFIHSTGIEIPSLSVPKEFTPVGDRRQHSSHLQLTPAGDTRGQSPSTHRTSRGNTRGQSSSLQLTHPVDRTELDRIPPPLQRQDRVRRPGWQQRTPYTDPSRPKRPRIMPQPPDVWAPHTLIDSNHLVAYQAYRRNSTRELRDVDLLEPVGVPWFHRFQTNIMELEDTHMDAYLHILRKRQRYYSTVYGPRINILDSQFYSWLLNDWERLMRSGADKPHRSWSLFKHQWSTDDLKVVLIPCNLGRTHWALASVDLTTGSIYLMDPFRQETEGRYDVHIANKPFPLNIVSRDRVPQQDRGGDCGAHTLRLIEYLAANRDTFD
ncbi:hypothetical protein LWI28_012586 [Acer negundo]|uniref:Ubiquitin-like protease family profile domain-containing protein n=1 Tax=Acer negundo TaxID=4023 RepID=A0AAD5I5Z2_ACENE|nr:hypothetical protein LWI28_012586 [Acer negundo]